MSLIFIQHSSHSMFHVFCIQAPPLPPSLFYVGYFFLLWQWGIQTSPPPGSAYVWNGLFWKCPWAVWVRSLYYKYPICQLVVCSYLFTVEWFVNCHWKVTRLCFKSSVCQLFVYCGMVCWMSLVSKGFVIYLQCIVVC